MVNTPQGAPDEIAKAQAVLNAVQKAFAESAEQERVAAASFEEAARSEALAKQSEAAAKQRFLPDATLSWGGKR
jgi:hypothetical protein